MAGEATDVARDAAEEYERSVPRPAFNGKHSVGLEYIDPSEQAGTKAGRASQGRRPRPVSGVEKGDGPRRRGVFPEEWGPAPTDPLSEARASWVRAKVREYRSLHALRELNRRDVETLNYLRMLAVEIAGKRWAPGEGDGV